MKVLILFFICGSAYGNDDFDGLIGFGNDDVNSNFGKAFQAKCSNNTDNENAFTELQDAFWNYFPCQESSFISVPYNPIEYHEEFCNYLSSTGLYGCVKNVVMSLESCLADTEKYLPHLLLNGLNSTYDEFCGVQGVDNLKLLYMKVFDNEKCSKRLRNVSWELACISDLVVLKHLQDGIIKLDKPDVCFDLQSTQTCLDDLLRRSCEEDFSQILDLAFRPFTQGCKNLLQD